jgi:catechol-2,3-dioxygenase
MGSPAKFAHVVYQTKRLGEMVDWYQTVLGCHIVYRNDFLAFLTYDDEHHRVALLAMPDIDGDGVNHKAVGVNHVAYTFDGLGSLLDLYVDMRDRDILPFWCTNHGPTTSIYYRDPDGNQLEMQVDNFPTVEEATRWMAGPKFAENPIGVDFDPDELLAKYRAGVPVEQLLVRPDGEPSPIPL